MVLIHKGDGRVAVSIHFAAEVPDGQFKAVSYEPYSLIKQVMIVIKEDGFECLMIGDLTRHYGNYMKSIYGKLHYFNYSRALLRKYISS